MGAMTETVELANVHSTPKRIVLGVIGLAVAIFPIWDLWLGFASVSLVAPVFWIIGLGAAGIGVTLVAAAVFGTSTQLVFAPDGIILHRNSAVRRQSLRLRAEDLGPIKVEEHEWSEGPSTWRVTVGLKSAKPLKSEDFRDAAGAKALAARIGQVLGRPVSQV
jgi:hypothetical protein